MTDHEDEARMALTTLGVGPAAKELYVDLLRPAAAEMGQNLLVAARVVSLAFAPLRGLVWGMDRISDWLKAALLKRLAAVPPEQIQSPPAHIAGQVLLQLPFCAEQEELREMYANLLASAMQENLADRVHPAFVQVIQQLAPDEVRVLEFIRRSQGNFELEEKTYPDGGSVRGTDYMSSMFDKLCKEAGVRVPAATDAYLDNLIRLRLFGETSWSEATQYEAGMGVFGDKEYEWDSHMENVSTRRIRLTEFGETFLEVCGSRVEDTNAAPPDK